MLVPSAGVGVAGDVFPLRSGTDKSCWARFKTYRCFIDRGIEPPRDTPDSRGQGRSGPQKAQFFVLFCGAGSSPPVVSTAVARKFEEKSAGLLADSELYTATYSGSKIVGEFLSASGGSGCPAETNASRAEATSGPTFTRQS